MGTHLISLQMAANLLGVTTRSLHTYVQKGLISFQRVGRSHQFDAVEVEELRKALQETGKRTVISPKEFALLQSRLTRVEAELSVVLRILDAKNDPLRMNNAYARDLFGAASAQLQVGQWTHAEMQPWSEIFLRIDETDFRTIAEAVDDSKPWKLFLRLCVAMTACVCALDSYLTSIELQELHRRLVEGRRRMRVAALIYSDLYLSDMDADLRRYALADAPSSVLDTVNAVLKRRKKQA